MTWTREKPTKPGWYCVYHAASDEAGLLQLEADIALQEVQKPSPEFDACIYYGPIPAPEEAT